MAERTRSRSLAAQPLAPVFDPGDLWHVGSIVSQTFADLPNGGQGLVDVIVAANEPMSVDPLSAIERAQPGAILAEATHKIRMYWVAGVRSAMRVVITDPYENRDRTFEILAVSNPMERALLLELTTIEKV
jgi:head-tail adaptor